MDVTVKGSPIGGQLNWGHPGIDPLTGKVFGWFTHSSSNIVTA